MAEMNIRQRLVGPLGCLKFLAAFLAPICTCLCMGGRFVYALLQEDVAARAREQ